MILWNQEGIKIISHTDNWREIVFHTEILIVVMDNVFDSVQRVLGLEMQIDADSGGNVGCHVAFRVRQAVPLE